jgi:hypothetical protein
VPISGLTAEVTVFDGDKSAKDSASDDVTAVNDPPETAAASGSGAEDAASISVALSGSDVDGTVVSFNITSLPANGTLYSDAGLTTVIASGGSVTASGNAATVYFVPAANWNGSTTFKYASVDNSSLEDKTPATATITVTPVPDIFSSADTYTTIEGGLLTVNAAGVLLNDTSLTAVAKFSAAANGASAQNAGAGTITTALGGDVTVYADGHFTYQITPITHAFGSDVKTDSFYYQATGLGETSGWEQVTINILDTHVDALNDYNGGLVKDMHSIGDVLTNDIISLDVPNKVTSVTFNGTSHPVPTDGTSTTIAGEFGTLSISNDGHYDYTVTGKEITPVAKAGAVLFGVYSSEVGGDGWVTNLTPADSLHAVDVKGSKFGWGVDLSQGGVIGKGEALVMELDNAYTGKIGFDVGQLNGGQGSNAHWTTYDVDGVQLASGIFTTNANGVIHADAMGDGNLAVKYISFTWDANNNGFVVTGVDLNTVGTDTFSYTVTDKDGDADSANLVFTGNTLTGTEPTGVEPISTPNLRDLLTDASHTVDSLPSGGGGTTVNISSDSVVEQTIQLDSVSSDEALKSLLNQNNTPTSP